MTKKDEQFVQQVKISLLKKGLTYKDLADKTGYKLSTIRAFMSDIPARDKSKRVGQAIADVLEITYKH